MSTALERARDHPAVVTALLVVGLFIALSVVGLQQLANVVLFVGIPVGVPLAYLLFAKRRVPSTSHDAPEESETTTADAADTEAEPTDELERLREQYASGEITEVEFEQRVEAYLEPEDSTEIPSDGAAIEAKLEQARNDD